MKLREMTERVEQWEREQAPGGETILRGEYMHRMWTLTGHYPAQSNDVPYELEIDGAEVSWWTQAYELHAQGMTWEDIVATL